MLENMDGRWLGVQPSARGTVGAIPGRQAGEEPRVELGSVALIDGDAGGAECLDETADELEDFGLLTLGEVAREFGAQKFKEEG